MNRSCHESFFDEFAFISFALSFCYIVFSSGEPETTSLENALASLNQAPLSARPSEYIPNLSESASKWPSFRSLEADGAWAET
jgi:hypothetical protein